MKLAITKKDGKFEIELRTASDKKPYKATVEPEQLDLLVTMLKTAKEATTFAFALEL